MRGTGAVLFAALIFVFSWSPASADFDDGLEAFEVKDYGTAFSEWKAAADQGDTKSQYRLGKLYEEGRGVPQNYVQAHLYYNLAAAQGSDEARAARDAVAGQMVKEELAEARKLAAAWKPGARGQVATPSQQAIQAEQEDPFALFEAADLGDAQRVEELLAGGMDAGIADAQGQTPLMFAAGNGHVDVVNQLLNAGADPDAIAQDGSTALLAATLGNHPAVIAALVEAGADVNAANTEGLTPLLAALLSKRPEAAGALIDGGAEVDAKLGDGTTALMLAIVSGQKETTQALLDTGADVNATNEEGVTALMAAARTADAALVSALLERGADAAHKNAADQTALDIADQGQDATTAELLLAEMPDRLMAAVERGLAEAVQRQIARGAKVNKAADNGWSPLMLASAKGDLQIALLLLAAEADVNHANKDGVTALMAAALGGHTEIVKALMQAGVDPQTKNKAGLTARNIAREKGHGEIAELLGPSKEQIAEVQRHLARLGYNPGPVDGVVGQRTVLAIKAYQKQAKLTEDGQISRQLAERLSKETRNIVVASSQGSFADCPVMTELIGEWFSPAIITDNPDSPFMYQHLLIAPTGHSIHENIRLPSTPDDSRDVYWRTQFVIRVADCGNMTVLGMWDDKNTSKPCVIHLAGDKFWASGQHCRSKYVFSRELPKRLSDRLQW